MLDFDNKKSLIRDISQHNNMDVHDIVNNLKNKFEDCVFDECIWNMYDCFKRPEDSFKITTLACILSIIDKNKDTSFVLDTFAGDSLDHDVYCGLWSVVFDYSNSVFGDYKLEYSELIQGMSTFLFHEK